MFITAKEAARKLDMEPHQVYYLLAMGEIESVRIGKCLRLMPESADEYARRHPARKNRKTSGNFVYTGNGGFLFNCVPDRVPPDSRRKADRMERRRWNLVHCEKRSNDILSEKHGSVTQLEMFAV